MAFIPKKRWKYAKPKKSMDFEEYLNLPDNKKVKLTIQNWNFSNGYVDGENRTILRTDVIKIDGKETKRILVIKNYDSVQELKKVLSRKKSARDTLNIEITKRYSEDDMENYYDIVF